MVEIWESFCSGTPDFLLDTFPFTSHVPLASASSAHQGPDTPTHSPECLLFLLSLEKVFHSYPILSSLQFTERSNPDLACCVLTQTFCSVLRDALLGLSPQPLLSHCVVSEDILLLASLQMGEYGLGGKKTPADLGLNPGSGSHQMFPQNSWILVNPFVNESLHGNGVS